MSDYMIRAMAGNQELRCAAVSSRDLLEEARRAHGTSPLASAALGRTMSGALMMSGMLKNDDDLITVRLDGDGPLGAIVVTADYHGRVKGYVQHPQVWLPLKENGHLDVGRAVGKGLLTVIRDLDSMNSYTGQTEIRTGEIAEDLTYYFAESEQVPSSMGLGVLVDTDQSIRRSGGFLVQLMPSASEETITRLEQNLSEIRSVTDMLEDGFTPEQMLGEVLRGFDDPEITERMPVRFYCSCSRDRVERALMLISGEDLQSLIDEDRGAELACQFCGKTYRFGTEDLIRIRLRSLNRGN